MNLQERIKSDLKTAMKEKNEEVKSLLRVVIGEFNREGKELDDIQAEKVLRKMVKSLTEVKTEEAKKEIEILEKYLPKLMTEDEIYAVVDKLISDGINNVGQIMQEFNKNYQGKADNKLVAQITKSKLNN